MKLDVRATALATGGISALHYALCAAFYAFGPESAVVYLTASFFHMDVAGIDRKFGWGTVIVGLPAWGLRTAAAAGAAAWLYNRLVQSEPQGLPVARREDVVGTG